MEIGEPNDVAGLIRKLEIRGFRADRKELAAEWEGHGFIILNEPASGCSPVGALRWRTTLPGMAQPTAVRLKVE